MNNYTEPFNFIITMRTMTNTSRRAPTTATMGTTVTMINLFPDKELEPVNFYVCMYVIYNIL